MVADRFGCFNEGLEFAVKGPEISFVETGFSVVGCLVEEILESETER